MNRDEYVNAPGPLDRFAGMARISQGDDCDAAIVAAREERRRLREIVWAQNVVIRDQRRWMDGGDKAIGGADAAFAYARAEIELERAREEGDLP